MARASPVITPVTTTVFHAPSANLNVTVTTRIARQSTEPKTNSATRFRQAGFSWCCRQCNTIPIIDKENVTNTLIEYITIKAETAPALAHSATRLLTPMSRMPLCDANRSDKLPNQCGTHESWAILARHLGPPIKP